MNDYNTVFDTQRYITRKFTDTGVQPDVKYWVFKFVFGTWDIKIIEVEYKEETKKFKGEGISLMIIVKMKEVAEAYLEQEVNIIVVKVTVYFNDFHRQVFLSGISNHT